MTTYKNKGSLLPFPQIKRGVGIFFPLNDDLIMVVPNLLIEFDFPTSHNSSNS